MKKKVDEMGYLRVRRLVVLFLACFSTFIVYQIRLSSVHLLKSRVLTAPEVSSENLLVLYLPREGQIRCDRTQSRYDLCMIDDSTVLDPTSYTFFTGPTNSTSNLAVKIKPYPRKFEGFVMGRIKDITITSGLPKKPCQVPHDVPALVFCAGGYTGNFFHEFNDGFIPLFITVNTIFPNQDFVIVISQGYNWWINKYADLLNVFTKHPIINLDNETTTHCFPSANIGLISHGFMIINDTLIPKSKSYFHFRSLLHKAYSQNFASSSPMSSFPKLTTRPRLLIVSRSGDIGRVIVNQDDVIKEMEEVGFDVIVFQPTSNTSLRDAYALVSSSHTMVGVHGAALTHSLFLRPGSVLVQVVPIGVEWASDASFGRVGRGLNLEYLEYRIGVEESSLVEKYGSESKLLKDPHALQIKGTGWPTEIMDIYLKEQNVRLDLVRFRKYLEKAYVKAKKFMYKEG